jgi:uncharacterized protein YbjQ (UPF0145 family)
MGIVIVFLLLVTTFFIGRLIERQHFAALAERERALTDLVTVTVSEIPGMQQAQRTGLVSGSAVVSLDYFKRFSAALKSLVGGRIRAYEPLLERGRREAVLRMRESARERGFDAVVRVRLQAATIDHTQGNQGIGAIEIIAYGTGIKRSR